MCLSPRLARLKSSSYAEQGASEAGVNVCDGEDAQDGGMEKRERFRERRKQTEKERCKTDG